ncbi:hypothetical protein [Saprospira grandis]|uniref:hypothetical protein n=1 Tax=Saprospira grandis TaxID=1008 RepID=UPI0022DD5C6E|nr:hypothetical protein [Saprospira grandis]WBM75357.1 hypothetical protein OP864_03740 [Saprospira grandis]
MKNLLFLTLALIGLGLSSCQKEEAPLAPVELTGITLLNYNEFKSIYYYNNYSRESWDEDVPGRPQEKYADVFVHVYYRRSPYQVDTLLKGRNILHNWPYDQSANIPISPIAFETGTEAMVEIRLLDYDEAGAHEVIDTFLFSMAAVRRNQMETAYLSTYSHNANTGSNIRIDVNYN